MFWTNDATLLLKPVLIPVDYMAFDEKMNTLTRLVIFVSIIVALVIQNVNVILFMIIMMIMIVIIYNYHSKYEKTTEKFLNENDLTIVDNEICVKPSNNNPLMNPDLTNVKDYDKYEISGACPSYNENIGKKIDEIFDKSSFINASDVYNQSSLLKRQFYTVPGNKVPNDQNKFADWLYNRGPSCKENNGERCYSNMYRDLRV